MNSKIITILCFWIFVKYISAENAWEHMIFREKCMEELGCFSNGPPFFDLWERPMSLLPADREDINTNFQFFTAENTNQSSLGHITNFNRQKDTLLNHGFRSDVKTVFIVPGFMSGIAPPLLKDLKDVLLSTDHFNIFIVSWTGGDGPWYEQAVANTRVVGAEIAAFIEFLEEDLRADRTAMHIIGHSLGAHIAGYVGKRIKGLQRITGLDPAGPYFENVDASVRLNASDAFLVDCIHTDKANSRFQGFGTTESICDLDFFPNGGFEQPGCPPKLIAAWHMLKNIFHREEFYHFICDHERAIELFIASIKNPGCPLIGTVCDSWESFHHGLCPPCPDEDHRNCISIGLHADQHLDHYLFEHKDLYLKTTATAPFCMSD